MRQTFRVEVFWQGRVDGRAVDLSEQIEHLDVHGVGGIEICDLYFLRGTLDEEDAQRIAVELLTDPVVEGFHLRPLDDPSPPLKSEAHAIEVAYHPGVTDPVAKHLLHRAAHLKIEGLEAAATGTRYLINGALTGEDVRTIAT